MYRVTGATLGTVAIGLVAVFLVVGMFGGGLLGASHLASGQAAKASPASSAGKATVPLSPAVNPNAGPIQISTTFTAPSPFPAYATLPFEVNFTITVVNATVSAATTTLFVNITDLSAKSVVTVNPQTVATGQSAWSFNVTSTTMGCDNSQCIGLPQDGFTVTVGVSVSNKSLTAFHPFFVVTTPLSATLVSPYNGSAVSTGNVTLAVAYLGSWIAGAVINIYSSTNALVYTHNMIELTPGVPSPQTWFAGQTGVYKYSIVMTTIYTPNTHYVNGTITVITKGGTVYQNVTQWSNESILSGLSGAAAGTLLLVVGLIVGMIVAFILAGLVMRSRPGPAPPQAWEGKAGAGTNTCSVCGKSFSTPEELAAHGKSEHGMQ